MLNAGQEHSWSCHPEHLHGVSPCVLGFSQHEGWVMRGSGPRASVPRGRIRSCWASKGLCPELPPYYFCHILLVRESQGLPRVKDMEKVAPPLDERMTMSHCTRAMWWVGDITAAIFGKYNLPYWKNDSIWTEACTKPYKKGGRDAKEEPAWTLLLRWLLAILSLHLREWVQVLPKPHTSK